MAHQPAGMALFTRWTHLNADVWVQPGSMNGNT